MIALLALYVTITGIVASIQAVLWAMERADSADRSYIIGYEEDVLAYARGFITAPLWPLYLVRATLALIADAMTSLKGNEYNDESE